MFATQASRLIMQAQRVTQQATRNVVSGPPTVKVTSAEKWVFGLVMIAGFMTVPTWVLVNIKNYRANEQ